MHPEGRIVIIDFQRNATELKQQLLDQARFGPFPLKDHLNSLTFELLPQLRTFPEVPDLLIAIKDGLMLRL